MEKTSFKTVVFITGAFVSHHGWDNWKVYFEKKGYRVVLPSWPGKEASASELRNETDSKIASVRLAEVIEHYIGIVQELPEKPILIGHSLGGLITQILLERGYASAGIAIDSVAPQGVIPTQLSFYKSTWKALGFLTSTRKPYLMSFEDWQYAFTNGMPLDEQRAAYDAYTIPESKLALRDGLTSIAKVDFNKTRGPLLLIAGEVDHTIPPALNMANYNRYKHNASITDFKLFEGRNHFIFGQTGWEEVAEYTLNWIETVYEAVPEEFESSYS